MILTLWEVSHHFTGPWAYHVYACTPGEAAKKRALYLDGEAPCLPPKSRTVFVRLPLDADEVALGVARAFGLAPRQVVSVEVRCLYHATVLHIESAAVTA